MTDPTLATSTSSGGSSRPSTVSASPSSTSTSPPTYPSVPASSSGGSSSSRPPTAPASPDRAQTVAQQMTGPPQPASPGGPEVPDVDGIVLGLQQLERQQAEQEQKRQALAAQAEPAPQDSSEDDDTAPSSTLNSNTNEVIEPGLTSEDRSSSIGRFIQNTRRRISSRDLAGSNPGNEPVIHPVYTKVPDMSEVTQFGGRPLLICGYLHKLGRNKKWQKRFFETDGENLSYYKTSDRTKTLATLDLLKVGEITMVPDDSDDCTFKIVIADRDYFLRADSRSSCEDWVITLNRIKEARMHLGHVQLVRPEHTTDKDASTARVVLSANRQRTKAVDGDDIHSWEDIVAAEEARQQQQHIEATMTHATRLSGGSKRLQEAVLARWQKRQTSLQRLAGRVIRWAKSVRRLNQRSCIDAEDQVVLDHHVHPPGHDDPPYVHSSADASRTSDTTGTSDTRNVDSGVGWIGKEPAVPHVVPTSQSRGSRDEDDDGTREIS